MKKNKIFFDISEMINFLNSFNYYSGIQRVVSMVIEEFQNQNYENLWICFINPHTHEYFTINLLELNFNNWSSALETKSLLKKLNLIGAGKLLSKYHNNKLKYYFHRLRLDIAAIAHNHKLFNQRNFTISDWESFRRKKHINTHVYKMENIIEPEDKLVLLDSTWKKEHTLNYFKLKNKGLKIYTFVHDLIPLLCSQWVHYESVQNFNFWLNNSIEYTDYYIANSKATYKDLQKFLNKKNCFTPLFTLPLVQNNLQKKDLKKSDKTDFQKKIQYLPFSLVEIADLDFRYKAGIKEPFVLCITTEENIKETANLLYSWNKKLNQSNFRMPRLIILKKGSKFSHDIEDILSSLNNLYGYVDIFDYPQNNNIITVLSKYSLFFISYFTQNGFTVSLDSLFSYGKNILTNKPLYISNSENNLVEICDFFSIEDISLKLDKLINDSCYRQNKELLIKKHKLQNRYLNYFVSRDGQILIDSIIDKPYVLHVGTNEIRKNTWRLALAWKKLLDDGKPNLPFLVLAGRKGWGNDNLWNLLEGTNNLYGNVVIIDKVSDEELDALYRNCLFTANISLYEGWGLPIGESLAYGKTSVVAKNTSLVEVGMDLVEYCDPLSINSIADAVEKLIYDFDYRQALESKIQQRKLRNWADVAHDLAEILQIKH